MINQGTSSVALMNKKRAVFVANTSWYLYNFRLSLIKDLIGKGFAVIALAPTDDYTGRLKSAGIEHFHLPLNRKRSTLLPDLLTIFSMAYRYAQINPDLAVHFTIKPVIFGTIIAKIFTKAKVINNITGLGFVFIGRTFFHEIIRPLVKWMYRCSLGLSRILIFQNEEDRLYFIREKIINNAKPKTIVIPGSGVDLEKFKRINKRTEPSTINFITVARMLWDKGIGEYVESAKIIKNLYTNVEFHLLGDIDEGNPTSISHHMITEWVNQGIAKYHGMTDDVRKYLENANVFVLPSYREGLSKSIIEAMAMELPIITTDVPGCRETVIPYVNGLLVKSKDAKSLMDAMVYMIKNPDKLIPMGKASRKIAEERFDVNLINREFLKSIENI